MGSLEVIPAKAVDSFLGRKDVVLIDLRSEEAFAYSHIKGAQNLPYKVVEEQGLEVFPRNKLLILYCDRGGASLLIGRKLAREGCRVKSVSGGFGAYRGRNLVF